MDGWMDFFPCLPSLAPPGGPLGPMIRILIRLLWAIVYYIYCMWCIFPNGDYNKYVHSMG